MRRVTAWSRGSRPVASPDPSDLVGKRAWEIGGVVKIYKVRLPGTAWNFWASFPAGIESSWEVHDEIVWIIEFL